MFCHGPILFVRSIPTGHIDRSEPERSDGPRSGDIFPVQRPGPKHRAGKISPLRLCSGQAASPRIASGAAVEMTERGWAKTGQVSGNVMISSRWPPPSLCCAATLFPAHRPCRPRPLRRAGVRKPPPAQQVFCSYNVLTRASSSLFPAAARFGRSSRHKAGYPRRQTELPPRLALAAPPPYLPRRRPYSRPRPGPPHTGETPAAGEGRRGRPRRGAGAVERGGLENRCAPCVPWVRIPPSPPPADFPSPVISTGTAPWGPWSGDIFSSRSKVRSTALERFLHAAPDRVRGSGRNDGEAGGRTAPQFA